MAVGLVLVATAALAQDPPLLSLTFGPDHLDFTPELILTVDVRTDSGPPDVLVTLDQSQRASLTRFTMAHVGQTGAIKVCGKLVSAPVLREPITGAAFVIGNDLAVDTRRLAAILNSKTCNAASP